MFWTEENFQIFVLLGEKHERDYNESKHCKITFENGNSLQAWKFERLMRLKIASCFHEEVLVNFAVWFTQL